MVNKTRMTLKSEKFTSDEAMSPLILLFIRSLLCTLCIFVSVCPVTAVPSQPNSQLYQAYLRSLGKGDVGPAVSNPVDTKANAMDRTTFEQALNAGMQLLITHFCILFRVLKISC